MAIDRIEPHLRDQEKDLSRHRREGNPFEAAVARGAIASLKARRRWLRKTAQELAPAKLGPLAYGSKRV